MNLFFKVANCIINKILLDSAVLTLKLLVVDCCQAHEMRLYNNKVKVIIEYELLTYKFISDY